LKLKPIMDTLDLVVIGGEWGEGRRTSFIGSYLLACRDPYTDRFLAIGRVATGITDEKLEELTVISKTSYFLKKGFMLSLSQR